MRDSKPFVLGFFLAMTMARANELLWIQPGQSGARAVATSTNTVATGDWDGSILLWNAADQKFLRTLHAHNALIKGLAFSADGRQLASASDDKTLRLWDVASSANATLANSSYQFVSVAFMNKSNQVVALDLGGNLSFYSTETKALVGSLNVGVGSLAMALSSDGDHVATAYGSAVRLWTLHNGTFQTLTGHTETVHSLAFSPSGNMLASGSGWAENTQDTSIRVWDVLNPGSAPKVLTGHPTGVFSLVFHPSKSELVSASYDGSIAIWDLNSGNLRVTADLQSGALAFTPDGATLIAGDQTIDEETFDQSPFSWPATSIQSIAFSPDGTLTITDDHWRPRVRDSLTGDTRFELNVNPEQKLSKLPPKAADGAPQIMRTAEVLSVSPDKNSLYLGGRIWSLETGEATYTLPGEPAILIPVIAPDWSGYLTSSLDSTNTAEFRSYPDGAIRSQLFNAKSYWSKSLAFSADSSTIASVGGYLFPYGGDFVDSTVRIWNAADGTLKRELTGATLLPSYVELSADGKYVGAVAEGNENEVCVWNLQTGQLVLRLRDSISGANAISFFPSDDLIAWGRETGIEIWNIAASNRVATLTNESFRITALAVDSTGRRIAFGRMDGAVGVAAVPFGQALKISATADPQQLALTFQTAPDQTYTLQSSVDFGVWNSVTNFPGPAALTETTILVPITGNQTVFQLKIAPSSQTPPRQL